MPTELNDVSLDSNHAPDVHLNLNVRGLNQSATLAINEQCAALHAQSKSVFRLGLGQSPFPVANPVVLDHCSQVVTAVSRICDWLKNGE